MRSSTETILVAVDDCVGQVLWTQYFLETQLYKVDDAIIDQDSNSTILLEKQWSYGSIVKYTHHINISNTIL